MERAVGEVFELKGVKLQVVEQIDCDDCYFWNNKHCTRKDRIDGGCGEVTRSNGDNVIFKQVKEEKKDDNINPSHYKAGGIKTIDYMKAKLGDGFEHYLAGNVIKYISRYKHKNGLEDCKKAAWYINKLIETLEEGE